MTYQICNRCVSDNSIPGIYFDDDGICNFCKIHDRLEKKFPLEEPDRLEKLFDKIKRDGTGKKYDCIVSLSGGTDSTYVLYLAKKYGLRPLAFHFDNCWNSDISERNIQNACTILDVEINTYTVNWEEFRKLQIAFLKASVPEAEIPTDMGLLGAVYQLADKFDIKYILNGHSFRMEGLAPLGWSNIDGKYINDVYKQFCEGKMSHFPNLTLTDIFYYNIIKRVNILHPLNYINYEKEKVKKILEKELNWEYYGGHHLESLYTKWIANYLLPIKFGIDKRIIEYSSYIRSDQITRESALIKLNEKYPDESELRKLVVQKLGVTDEFINEIMSLPLRNFKDYDTYYPLLKNISVVIGFVARLGLLGDLGFTFVEKYSTY